MIGKPIDIKLKYFVKYYLTTNDNRNILTKIK